IFDSDGPLVMVAGDALATRRRPSPSACDKDGNEMVTMTVTMNQSQPDQPNFPKSRIGLIPTIFGSPKPSRTSQTNTHPNRMSPVQIRLARPKALLPLGSRAFYLSASTRFIRFYPMNEVPALPGASSRILTQPTASATSSNHSDHDQSEYATFRILVYSK
ncbi:hypothetical protein, partial [Bifidobacterium sp. UTCIF-24]|uniref:hypothetical protein n=1 Tax=Bifidobacterium sp. UTCIF-24 TaxID=1465256 RepID=UPI001C6152EF